ncbi:hypothetical protein TorRG33x02_352580, partial [Trema orientale]
MSRGGRISREVYKRMGFASWSLFLRVLLVLQ